MDDPPARSEQAEVQALVSTQQRSKFVYPIVGCKSNATNSLHCVFGAWRAFIHGTRESGGMRLTLPNFTADWGPVGGNPSAGRGTPAGKSGPRPDCSVGDPL